MATEALKILAIDDNPDNLIALKAVVRDALPGAAVVTALSGPQGIALARAEDPDVILLDIVMPGIDGYAVCRALKADNRLRYIPVVFLTALRTDRASRIQALEAGAEAFLAMPLDEPELIAQIRAMAKIKAANQMQRLEREQLAARVAERTRELEQELAERKRIDEALRESEERYRLLIETSPDGIGMASPDGRLLLANRQVATLFGYADPAEMTAVNLFELFAPEERGRAIKNFGAISQRGATLEAEYVMVRRDGTHFYGSISGALQRDANGAPRALIGLIRDITERKRAEEAIREQHEMMDYVIRHDPNAIAVYDRDLRYVFVSEKYLKDYGVKKQDIIGKHHYEVFPEMPQRWKDVHQRVLAGAIERNDDDSFERPDGSITYNRWECRPWYWVGGEIGGMITYTEVTTERKRAEEALRESEARYRAVTHSANDAIITADAAGMIVGWNQGAERIFGYTEAESRGQPLTLLLPPRYHNQQLEGMRRVQAGGARHVIGKTVEVAGLRKDGREFPLDLSLAEWEITEGRFYTAIIRDITERKQAEQRAFELALERERVGLLTKFINDASHEFRTPLAIMQTNVYLLERLDDPAKRQRKLTQIGDQVTGLTRLVDLLAEITRLDSGVPFTTAPTDLNLLVGAVAAKVQAQVAAKSLTLHQALAPDLPPISADGNRLGRALHELLANAVRYTPVGGSITVRTAGAAAGVTVEVADTGPGIPPDVLPHIFERFYRRDVAHTTPGFGLGLPIARAIVERHGGRLEVESQPGAGSVFRIRLPLPNSAEASAE